MSTTALIEEAASFTARRHRWPSRSPMVKDTTERRLATDLANLRTHKQAAADSMRLACALTGWADTPTVAWHEDAEGLGTHQFVAGRFPSQSSYDPAEVELAKWHTQQKGIRRGAGWAFGTHTPGQATFIDASAPGWDRVRDFEAEFRGRVQEVAAWVRANDGRLPRWAGDDEEARLARMVARWRSALRGRDGRHDSKFTSERVAYLDEHLPGWKGSQRKTKSATLRQGEWDKSADTTLRWVRKHDGLFPNRSSFDRAERTLGWWIYEQRNAFDRGTAATTPKRRAWLDDNLSGWRDYMRQDSATKPSVRPRAASVRSTKAS